MMAFTCGVEVNEDDVSDSSPLPPTSNRRTGHKVGRPAIGAANVGGGEENVGAMGEIAGKAGEGGKKDGKLGGRAVVGLDETDAKNASVASLCPEGGGRLAPTCEVTCANDARGRVSGRIAPSG